MPVDADNDIRLVLSLMPIVRPSMDAANFGDDSLNPDIFFDVDNFSELYVGAIFYQKCFLCNFLALDEEGFFKNVF